jgi:HEPN domain-containing protein
LTPKRVPSRREERGAHANYLAKAEEVFRSALDNAASRRWNAAALSAIHAGIAAADAVLVLERGIRSVSQRHEDVLDLLAGSGTGRSSALAYLRRILARKNVVEYESRLFTQREAEEVVQHAERFLGWARTRVRPAAP